MESGRSGGGACKYTEYLALSIQRKGITYYRPLPPYVYLSLLVRIPAMKKHRLSLPPFFSLLPLSIPRSISFPPRNGGNFEGNGGKGERGKGRERGKKERKEGEEVVVSQTVRKRLTPRIKWYRNETIVEQMPGHKTTASSFPPPIALSTPAEKAN